LTGARIGKAPITLVLPVVFLVLLSSPSLMHAQTKVEVTDVSYWSYPDYTRIVIALSGNSEFSQKRLSDPDRLYFDIRNSVIKEELKTTQPVGNGMLKSIRAGQFDPDTVRIVLDLGKIRDYKITDQDPEKIIVDVYGETAFSLKKRIVIDAGHGGHDPGATGPNNLREKDVVLDIALKLKQILSRDPNLDVYLTRDRDIFLKLDERTAIANSKNADLFVSIHANASTRRAAKGIETYLLNWTSDEEAMKVAARENQISLRKMKKMHRERNVLDIIKSDLTRENKRDESVKLANYIQNSMVNELDGEYEDVVDLGVKQALFYVLFGAEMPSVLVEVSFISNPGEERLLSKDDYRAELAQSIAAGVRKYMAASPEMRTVAGIRRASYSGN
jgi:N-acetylmuramoyl-L-alanine amidase